MKAMKKVLLILCLHLAVASFVSPVNEIVKALNTGNAGQLSKYFDNYIELTIDDRTASYSKVQAEMIIRNFFNTHDVKSYTSLNITTNTTRQYYLGTLLTNNGNYQVSVLVSQIGGKQLIQQLSFDK